MDETRFRNVILITSLAALVLWMVYGWDSGIDQIFNPETYGRSFHFSTLTMYGLLYFFTSKHLETWELSGIRNIVYSICLVALNSMIFELPYMVLFQHFQLRSNLTTWFLNDFLFLQQYLTVFLIGILGPIGIYLETKGKTKYIENGAFLFYCVTLFLFLFWIFYPFPTETVTHGLWTSNHLFPQTHYAYVNPTLYTPNDLLHSVNVGVKALIAYTQLHTTRSFHLCKTC